MAAPYPQQAPPTYAPYPQQAPPPQYAPSASGTADRTSGSRWNTPDYCGSNLSGRIIARDGYPSMDSWLYGIRSARDGRSIPRSGIGRDCLFFPGNPRRILRHAENAFRIGDCGRSIGTSFNPRIDRPDPDCSGA